MIHSFINAELHDQISLHALSLLEREESAGFEAHLDQCQLCRSEVEAYRETASDLAFTAPRATPALDLRRRLLLETAPQNVQVRANEGIWIKTGHEGVELRHLFTDHSSGTSTVMVRMKAGASYGAHHHKGYEHCYVLEGDVSSEDCTLYAGDYEVNAPGTEHPPIHTLNGCLLLLVTKLSDAAPLV